MSAVRLHLPGSAGPPRPSYRRPVRRRRSSAVPQSKISISADDPCSKIASRLDRRKTIVAPRKAEIRLRTFRDSPIQSRCARTRQILGHQDDPAAVVNRATVDDSSNPGQARRCVRCPCNEAFRGSEGDRAGSIDLVGGRSACRNPRPVKRCARPRPWISFRFFFSRRHVRHGLRVSAHLRRRATSLRPPNSRESKVAEAGGGPNLRRRWGP